ncbi:bone morphogenetic protein 10 [Denticeps clupeoides]|uniref:bone morphogenetic protein 10 n=1 Tax=Denticeps clupeoides TaxID=299321 RepID=UPI0010A2EB92|nr:bone morphogenetic protein 10 [Denticeps clupeoides]
MASTGASRFQSVSAIVSLVMLVVPCSQLVDGSPIMSPERHRPALGLEDGRGGVVDPSLLEQDSEVDMKRLLETLRGQFLRTFNLSGMGPPMQPGVARVEPPEYMLELYNRFANDRTSMPTANIIRSFKNEDLSPCSVGPKGIRRHPLLFNVSLPHHERVTSAELRLYTLVQIDRRLYAGVDRKVTVYEVVQYDTGDAAGEYGDQLELAELASRQVYGMDNGWESFDMTTAIHRWRKSEYSTTHRLEVHIASLNSEDEETNGGLDHGDGGQSQDGTMEIDTNQEDRHKPLMIVFSDDQSGDHKGDKRELNEMIGYEATGVGLQDNLELLREMELAGMGPEGDEGEPDEEALLQMRSNLIYDTAARIRRNAKGNQCKRNSLYVEFKDIGWDSWILAPPGYEAYECAGICTYPLTKHVTPTKHAIIQTLVNLKTPHKVSRACCVPTKLDPISLLYLDDTGVVTYKYKFEGMVVAECGCR